MNDVEEIDKAKERELFLRKPLLNRSPQNKKMKDTDDKIEAEKENKRRNCEETTLDDLACLIEQKSERQLIEINKMIKLEMNDMKKEINKNLDKSLQNMNKKIDLIEIKADQGLRMAMDNRKLCMNMIKQSRLDCSMDISGLKIMDGIDLKNLVVNTIRSFKIQIDDADIKNVVVHEIKKPNLGSNKILTVTFTDLATKLRVMREKNKVKATNGIFFNITLTPENGYFMRKAKYITKNTNFKPKLNDNAVCVKFNDDNVMIIQSEENLLELKNAIDELLKQESVMDVQTSGQSTN